MAGHHGQQNQSTEFRKKKNPLDLIVLNENIDHCCESLLLKSREKTKMTQNPSISTL